jgi:hypothetical protein
VPGSDRYQLNAEAIASHDRNLGPEELRKLFGRVGIEKLWEKLGAAQLIQNHFQVTDPNKAQIDAQTKLNEYILLRNQVAHYGRGESSIGPDALIQWMSYFLVLVESLSIIAAEYANGLIPAHAPESTSA